MEKELRKELGLRQEEYSSNLREQTESIQKLQILLQVKEDQMKQLSKRLEMQEGDTAKARKQLEEANKTIREISAQFVVNSKVDQQTIARKTKELETVLREKKCSNCILCVEDVRLKCQQDSAQMTAQISLLNDNLVAKALKVSELEEGMRQAS